MGFLIEPTEVPRILNKTPNVLSPGVDSFLSRRRGSLVDGLSGLSGGPRAALGEVGDRNRRSYRSNGLDIDSVTLINNSSLIKTQSENIENKVFNKTY